MPGHADVEEDRVEVVLGERAQRFRAVRGRGHGAGRRQRAQQAGQVRQGGRLVVDHQHVQGALAHAALTPGCDFGTVSRTSVPSPCADTISSP